MVRADPVAVAVTHTIAFIPARGGSTRVQGKNLQEVGGRSLLARAIAAARDGGVARVVVSTNDPEIEAQAIACESEVHVRPDALADAHAQIEEAISHWLESGLSRVCGDETIVMLHPTSPFRSARTVRAAVDAARASESGCAITVTHDPHAYFKGTLAADPIHGPVVKWAMPRSTRPRSQDLYGVVREDGCVYVFPVQHFLACRSRMHPHAVPVVLDWLESFEIDEPEQLDVARALAPMMDARW